MAKTSKPKAETKPKGKVKSKEASTPTLKQQHKQYIEHNTPKEVDQNGFHQMEKEEGSILSINVEAENVASIEVVKKDGEEIVVNVNGQPFDLAQEQVIHKAQTEYLETEKARTDNKSNTDAFKVEKDGDYYKITTKHCVVWLTQKDMDDNKILKAINNPVAYKKK